jgi:hypothetical protein
MDSESDIRLFVNSPGGSLRYPPVQTRSYIYSLGLCCVYPVSRECLWWSYIIPIGHLVGKLLCANTYSIHSGTQSCLFGLI